MKQERCQPTVDGTWRALKGWQTRRDKNLAEDYLSDRFWKGHEYGTSNHLKEAVSFCLRRVVMVENKGELIERKGKRKQYLVYGKDHLGGVRILSYVIDYENVVPTIVRITDLMC